MAAKPLYVGRKKRLSAEVINNKAPAVRHSRTAGLFSFALIVRGIF